MSICLCLLAFCLIPAQSVLGAVYKYKQENVTTYQDAPLLSARDNAHSILNSQGRTIERVLNKEDRIRELAVKRARLLAKHKDRALLATFSTEHDLIRTRDDRLGIINGYIERLDERIEILNSKLEILARRILRQEKASGHARKDLYEQRERTSEDIETAWDLVDAKSLERSALRSKFKIDLARYRYLKNNRHIN